MKISDTLDDRELVCEDCEITSADADIAQRHLGRARPYLCDECYATALDDLRAEQSDYGHDDDFIDGVGFADPGGRSALRAATPDNPRIHPCPTCGAPERLTPLDVARGYQCDSCADAVERGYDR